MRTVVVVEGGSDAVALRTLAHRMDRPLDDVEVVVLGGATNVGRYLAGLERGTRVLGLYDAPEERFFRRGLERAGWGEVPDRERLEQLGFFACVADLEDELIRALGGRGMEAVIAANGELASLRVLQHQPAQRGRPLPDQLRRFIGGRSGNKEIYARLMVEALDLDRAPRPMVALLDRL